jgi:hypothetical protein
VPEKGLIHGRKQIAFLLLRLFCIFAREGKLLSYKNISSHSRHAQLELSQIPAGVYYVLLMNNERAERTKISVIK